MSTPAGDPDESPVSRHFESLRSRLRRLEQEYNPDNENLHFNPLSQADSELYPAMLALADEGLQVVRQHDAYFSRHALYDDGMYWYDLFLFISAAAARIRIDKSPASVSPELVDGLILILARMTRYSNVHGGDIAKRNDEALGNTLLAFYNKKRILDLKVRSKREPMQIDWVLTRVAQVRKEMKTASRGDAGQS
jgi:hypothetical protein